MEENFNLEVIEKVMFSIEELINQLKDIFPKLDVDLNKYFEIAYALEELSLLHSHLNKELFNQISKRGNMYLEQVQAIQADAFQIYGACMTNINIDLLAEHVSDELREMFYNEMAQHHVKWRVLV